MANITVLQHSLWLKKNILYSYMYIQVNITMNVIITVD